MWFVPIISIFSLKMASIHEIPIFVVFFSLSAFYSVVSLLSLDRDFEE